MKSIRNWLSKKWQLVKKSRSFLAIIMLLIGVSYTVSYYEFKNLWIDYQDALTTFERVKNREVGVVVTAVAHASTEQNVAVMAQQGEKVNSLSTSTAQFTAYNTEVGQTDSDPFTMASGKKVYEGAVANNCLAFGTKIKVNGKIKVVEDRMNSRYDCDHFDIFMESHDEAIKFGKQEIEYEII